MTNTIYIHQPEKAFSFTRLPNFLFEAPTFKPLSNEAKVLYAFILRRTELSRKNGWADDCGRIFLYYPICEVVTLLHCGRQKAVNILSFCELAAGGRNGLEPVEKTVIDRAVRTVYRPYLADPKPENVPILEDLYNEILRQPEPEAKRIAAALELYVHGSLNVFNHRTNVDINNRLVCFDIKELGKQLKNLGMLVIQDQVWNRVTVNRSEGKSTRYYVDEFHLLLRGEVGSWSVEIWKRFRKWGGIPTGITQNIKDLLASPEIENIFENSDFIYLLNQASGDRKILCERLNISTQQAAHISNAGPGEGLIFFGNVILPFADRFPQDNELYSIMTTRPGEAAAEAEEGGHDGK